MYKIWIFTRHYYYRGHPRETYRFSLILDPSHPPALQHQSSFTVDSEVTWDIYVEGEEYNRDTTVSYASHKIVFRRVTGIDGHARDIHQLFRIEDNDGIDLKLPSSIGRIGISPYSGAVFYHDYTHGTMVVNFYK